MGNKLLLFIIVFLALFLRFWSIAINPPSPTWDEVSWGYNAYSLGIDASDEFGSFLPLTFLESFGDFKPPVYAYLALVPVKLFGLNDFATRFPSAFFGTFTVLLTFFLTKEIFTKSPHREKIALIACGILAISSWHILLSRAAFEANVATFFIVLGVFLFLLSMRKSPWLLTVSFLSLLVSAYTFNTARIVAPLILIGLVFVFRSKILAIKQQLIVAVLTSFIVFLPLGLFLLTPQASLRFKEVNIFSDPQTIVRLNQHVANDDNALWSKVIHNRRLAYFADYVKHYLDNLSPSFLFVKGDGNPKFSIQDVGQMYVWEFPFFIAGILLLFKKKEGYWWIIPYWLLIGLIPAATARETPHALRTEVSLPTFQILTAYGLFYVLAKIASLHYQFGNFKLSNTYAKYILYYSMGFLIMFNFLYFIHNYSAHYSKEFSGEWQYGYKEAVLYVKSVQDKYDTVYFTESLGRPYIYFLYYLQYDPQKFRAEATISREVFGFVHVESFDKYHFSKEISIYTNSPNALFVDTPGRLPAGASVLKEFRLLNGQTALIAYTF